MTGLAACDADKPVSGSSSNTNPFALIAGGSSGRSFLTLDNSTVRGYLSVAATQSLDSRWGSGVAETSLNAICGDATGNPATIASAKANGVGLSQLGSEDHILCSDGPNDAINPGQNVTWDVRLANGVTFNDGILLPAMPTITNLNEYADYSKSAPLSIQWTPGDDPNAEAVISLAVDPIITAEEGGDVSQIHRGTTATLVYTETGNDNGSFDVPASVLAGFPSNVNVRVTVGTFNYQTKARSDGELYGLVARSQYSTVIKLTP